MNFILSFLGLISFAVIAFIIGAIAMFSCLMYALVACKDNDYERFTSALKKARQERKFGNEDF